MILGIISIIGLFIGWIIANYTKEELKQGEKYFIILQFIVLVSLFFITLEQNINILFLIIAIIMGVLIRNPFVYFGVALVPLSSFLSIMLIFIYGIAEGSINYITKDIKKLIINVILFIIPFLLILFNIKLTPILNGGIIGVLIYQIYDQLIIKKKLSSDNLLKSSIK